MTAQTPEESRVIEAQMFICKDAKGNVRAKLGVDMDGQVRLSLLDLEGEIRAVMKLSEDGEPGLYLYDRGSNKPAAWLTVSLDDPTPTLFLSNKKGHSVWLAVTKDSAFVAIVDEHQEVVWSAPEVA